MIFFLEKKLFQYSQENAFPVPARDRMSLIWIGMIPLISAESRNEKKIKEIVSTINESVIGKDLTFNGPFGVKQVTYCDYIASGRALTFIEDFIKEEVLPRYGNTHSTTTVTALQTTVFRDEAKDIIRSAVNATADDAVIFAGSGCTGAVNKLVHVIQPAFKERDPVVFVGAMEHHSNLLPWRESGAKIIMIPDDDYGRLDTNFLEKQLSQYSQEKHTLIGCFCAASNVTGILNDDLKITSILHHHGALAFWDYAAAAPYVNIDMNPKYKEHDMKSSNEIVRIALKMKNPNKNTGKLELDLDFVPSDFESKGSLLPNEYQKDAIYFSMHKFIGGPQTPGVLVAKKRLFKNPVPHGVGGGAVLFVTEENHSYHQNVEHKEEGGTPAIIESIRAGLAMQLKQSVSSFYIMEREHDLMGMAYSKLKELKNIILLGSPDLPRLPIISFLLFNPQSGLFLHHNFVCTLLSDMFGIEARGGCACAGPYGQRLLGLSQEQAVQYSAILTEDYEVFKPGFARLNLSWFAKNNEIEYVLKALELISENGWKMLPQYRFQQNTGVWKHHKQITRSKSFFKSLGNISLKDRKFIKSTNRWLKKEPKSPPYCMMLNEALKQFKEAKRIAEKQYWLLINDPQIKGYEHLKWFLLPFEAQRILCKDLSLNLKAPFVPKTYLPLPDQRNLAVGSYFQDGQEPSSMLKGVEEEKNGFDTVAKLASLTLLESLLIKHPDSHDQGKWYPRKDSNQSPGVVLMHALSGWS